MDFAELEKLPIQKMFIENICKEYPTMNSFSNIKALDSRPDLFGKWLPVRDPATLSSVRSRVCSFLVPAGAGPHPSAPGVQSAHA